jgi:hypothetical protein
MTIAPLSLALVAQALPMGQMGMTFAEGVVVSFALLSVLVIGFWVRHE